MSVPWRLRRGEQAEYYITNIRAVETRALAGIMSARLNGLAYELTNGARNPPEGQDRGPTSLWHGSRTNRMVQLAQDAAREARNAETAAELADLRPDRGVPYTVGSSVREVQDSESLRNLVSSYMILQRFTRTPGDRQETLVYLRHRKLFLRKAMRYFFDYEEAIYEDAGLGQNVLLGFITSLFMDFYQLDT